MKNNFSLLYLLGILSLCSCYTTKNALSSTEDASGLNWGHRDSISIDTKHDGSGDGVFGRKVIHRDLGSFRRPIHTSGTIAMKLCINRLGIVTYVELLPIETTITDKDVLKTYLRAARGYKFGPLSTAPKEQCGKIKFNIDNSLGNKLR